MISFVNLMADDDWSDQDIINRTEAVIGAEFPPTVFAILQRKVQGQMMGYVLTVVEQAQLAHYVAVSYAAGMLADQARVDMELLRHIWRVEAAQRALAVDPNGEGAAEHQAVIDTAPEDVMLIVNARAAARAYDEG